MYDVPSQESRGGHAHRETDQMAVAVNGSLELIVSDGMNSFTILLDKPTWGIFLPKLTWTSLNNFTEDAVCLVFANTHYDKTKSIRTWSDYLAERGFAERAEFKSGPIFRRPNFTS